MILTSNSEKLHDILRTYMFFDQGGGGSLGFLTFFKSSYLLAFNARQIQGRPVKKIHPVYTFK